MKINKWTYGLAAAGLVSLVSTAQAEETFVETMVSGTSLSGYVSTSAIWHPGEDPGGAMLPGRTYTGMYKQDGFNLDAVKLRISKPLEDTGTWAAGYNVGLVFGHDASLLDPSGSSAGFTDGDGEFYTGDYETAVAIQEAYVTVRAPVGNGLDITMGIFPTVIGYEVFDHDGNDFYSRSYGFFIEPINHTGVMASYEFNEIVSANFGVANTPTVGFRNDRPAKRFTNNMGTMVGNDETEKTILGNIVITAPESSGAIAGSTLVVGAVYGQAANDPSEPTGTNYYVGGTLNTPIDGLTAGFAFDYLAANQADVAGSDDSKAYTIGGYAKYQLTPKASVQGRVEYAKGEDADFWGSGLDTGNEEKFLGVTLATDYKVTDNLTARGEVRYDKDLADRPAGGDVFGAYLDPQDDSWMLALQAIYGF